MFKHYKMDSTNFTQELEAKEQLLKAHAHLWNNIFQFIKSMALKCAIELGIPDTIHKHGNPMTLSELANSLPIHPTKAPSLRRLMRLLVSSNFFSKDTQSNGEETFALTLSSQLLIKDHPLSQAAFALAMLDPILVDPSHHLSSSFQQEGGCCFEIAHGKSFWEQTSHAANFNEQFNKSMESDSRFVTSLLVSNNGFKGLFEGMKTVVDVGGGTGTAAKAIAEAYPWLKCSVLELSHVVEGLQANGSNLVYFAGDMFQAIPHADVVLLKWILHDWSDEDCIKILERCKEAIPCKHEGGKVIIIDIVLDTNNPTSSNTQLLFDMEMMFVTEGGKERTEEEWKKLLTKAGFSDYEILPILGLRSVIVLYPS